MTADRIPSGSLERLIDKYAPEGVDLVIPAQSPAMMSPEEAAEVEAELAAMDVEQAHDELQRVTGQQPHGRIRFDSVGHAEEDWQRAVAGPHASKRGDEGMTIGAVTLRVGDIITINDERFTIVQILPDKTLELTRA